MSLTNFFINRKLLLLNIVLALYIATNLVGGERGIVSFFKKKNVEKNLILEEKKLISKLNEIDKKNNLLSKNIDLDFLEMIYRDKLKFGKKDEVIIKLK
jgi:cell division protein DivIC